MRMDRWADLEPVRASDVDKDREPSVPYSIHGEIVSPSKLGLMRIPFGFSGVVDVVVVGSAEVVDIRSISEVVVSPDVAMDSATVDSVSVSKAVSEEVMMASEVEATPEVAIDSINTVLVVEAVVASKVVAGTEVVRDSAVRVSASVADDGVGNKVSETVRSAVVVERSVVA